MSKLRDFHQQHFLGQAIPDIQPLSNDNVCVEIEQSSADLGFYEDGVRRTLTDAQVAMFRHSEVQRLLSERRRQKELEEEQRQKQERIRRSNAQMSRNRDQRSQFDDDAATHTRAGATELRYDENNDQQANKPLTFQWPSLGS